MFSMWRTGSTRFTGSAGTDLQPLLNFSKIDLFM
jgi:hypothetical protein